MVIAYLRVSTGKQHLENQHDEIRRFAAEKDLIIDRWVTETVSGKTREKDRKLGALLKKLKPGDILIVTELSRLSRTLTDIMAIMGKCLKKKIILYSTKDGYAFDDSLNSKVLCFAFGLVAEIERNLISLRTKEALAMRKSAGITLGRPRGSCPKMQILVDHKAEIKKMIKHNIPISEICRRYEVSRDTFSKFRDREPGLPREAFRKKPPLPPAPDRDIKYGITSAPGKNRI